MNQSVGEGFKMLNQFNGHIPGFLSWIAAIFPLLYFIGLFFFVRYMRKRVKEADEKTKKATLDYMNAEGAELVLSYHPLSNAGLEPRDEQELTGRLLSRGATVAFKSFPRPHSSSDVASILGPGPKAVIIKLTGNVADKLLEGIAKDIFLFFQKKLKGLIEEQSIEHFGILLDITSQGQRYHVGFDFHDETTLIINSYRLHTYLGHPISYKKNGFIELEYPKSDSLRLILASIILTAITVISSIVIIGFGKLSTTTGLLVCGLVLSMIWGYVLIIFPRYQRRKYYFEFKDEAVKWALEISPPSYLGKNSTLNIQLVDDSMRSNAADTESPGTGSETSSTNRNSASFQYDVVLSFAGEDRDYVEQVADALRSACIRVFYDKFETVELWGKDLYKHLDGIYRHSARFCLLFVSKNYADKLWTNHERESAQARAFQENSEYILPCRFDDTEIPGIRPTLGYVDLRLTSPKMLAEMVAKKLSSADRERRDRLLK